MIIHHPVIWKIVGLRLLSFEDIPKEVIKQLIPHLVDRSGDPRLSNLSNLTLNDIFLLILQLIFLLKLVGLIFLHTGLSFPINVLKLGSVVYLLAQGKQLGFAFPELFFEDQNVAEEKLAGYDDVDVAVVDAVYLVVFADLFV